MTEFVDRNPAVVIIIVFCITIVILSIIDAIVRMQ